ncbi:MAG: ATP-dependent nuclease [Candidatus Hodarchaeales archaeon]|jgi:predicted ATP-dependent endonuclease of OLD family
MFLKQVQLKNFRSITSLSLPALKNLNCFIGGHNSGKTNILDGISVFWDDHVRSNTLHRQFQSDVMAPVKEDFDRGILSYLDSNHIDGSFDFLAHKTKGLLLWRNNEYLKQQFTETAIAFKMGNPFDCYDKFIDELCSIVNLEKISNLKFKLSLNPELLEFTSESLFFGLSSEEYIKYESINVPITIVRQAVGSAFIKRFHDVASEFETLRTEIVSILKGKDYQRISAIEKFLKDVIGQEFVFQIGGKDPDGKTQIEVTIEQAFSGPLWRISNGTIRIIALACLLTSNPMIRQIILIDNPGLFLHPRGERNLARKLETYAKTRQFLFSTHSPRLLIGHAHLVELKNGWTNVERIKGRKSMRRVVNLLGIRPSDSFGSDIVVFVEGRTDARVFRVFEDKISRAQTQLPRIRISYTAVGGWTNIKYILSLELLRTKFVRSRAVAITDGDIVDSKSYEKVKGNWDNVFGERGTFFSLREECVESLFLNNPIVFIRLFSEKSDKSPSLEELSETITKRRNRGLSDKTITKDLVIKYKISGKYSSTVAERLARQFEVNEIPSYLTEFYEKNIFRYE